MLKAKRSFSNVGIPENRPSANPFENPSGSAGSPIKS
jgi:hypothetical protein